MIHEIDEKRESHLCGICFTASVIIVAAVTCEAAIAEDESESVQEWNFDRRGDGGAAQDQKGTQFLFLPSLLYLKTVEFLCGMPGICSNEYALRTLDFSRLFGAVKLDK